MPLGGIGEIGKNMTLISYGRNQIVVDCGVMFPESDMYGIDLVLPRFDYVVETQSILRGIVLTHGHMDHIGGLPYLLKHISTPIYGTALTIGMVQRMLKEAGVLERATLHVIDDQQTLHLGPFRVSPFAVAHSIPGSVGLVIDTPVGAVVHTGDYKLDETPTGGTTTDLQRLRELTPNGVLALLADSTNADRQGRTPTEQLVADTLDQLFAEATDGRIIIATFSSLLARLQEIIRLADKYGRKVALTGRSLQQNVELACELGVLNIPKGLLVNISAQVPDNKLVILSTGSQGELRSALNRMALGEHAQVQVHTGDTIIVSGGTIPGNEEDVGRMLNKLFARGANVIYGALATVHVSGHGSREDMRIMLETVRPRFLIPVHGETRHLHLHAQLAQRSGMSAENIFILANGARWTSDGHSAALGEPIPAGDIYMDGARVGEMGDGVVRERGRLAQDGFVVVYVPVDKNQRLVGEPRIVSHGFLPQDTAQPLLNAAQAKLKRTLQRDKRTHTNSVQKTLQTFFYDKTQSRPLILSNIVRV
jgi:ribonuclease J